MGLPTLAQNGLPSIAQIRLSYLSRISTYITINWSSSN